MNDCVHYAAVGSCCGGSGLGWLAWPGQANPTIRTATFSSGIITELPL